MTLHNLRLIQIILRRITTLLLNLDLDISKSIF